MRDNNLDGEQLSLSQSASATDFVGFDNVSQDDFGSSPNLGKFKNVEQLLKAYNNLQSEFTKKCQAFNELLKERNEVDNVNITPTFEKEDWQTKVDNFLQRYPQAKKFSKQIAEVISSDKDLIYSSNSLEMAFCKVMEDENFRLNNLINDKDFIVKNIDEDSKKSILNEYLSQINNNSPALINSKGGNNIVATYRKPLSVIEAGELAKKMFK